MKNSRQYQRESSDGKVTLVMEGKTKKFRILDFSKGGISFISGEVVPDGEHIELIHNKGKLELVVLDGNFDWLSERTSTAGYRIRCQFCPDLRDPDWKRIKDCLYPTSE